jgi:hypothetical protein
LTFYVGEECSSREDKRFSGKNDLQLTVKTTDTLQRRVDYPQVIHKLPTTSRKRTLAWPVKTVLHQVGDRGAAVEFPVEPVVLDAVLGEARGGFRAVAGADGLRHGFDQSAKNRSLRLP